MNRTGRQATEVSVCATRTYRRPVASVSHTGSMLRMYRLWMAVTYRLLHIDQRLQMYCIHAMLYIDCGS